MAQEETNMIEEVFGKSNLRIYDFKLGNLVFRINYDPDGLVDNWIHLSFHLSYKYKMISFHLAYKNKYPFIILGFNNIYPSMFKDIDKYLDCSADGV